MYYFAYASNLNRKQMQERCPESKPRFTATLHHYQLVFTGWSRTWRGGVATIRSFRGEKVRGGIYEVSAECLNRLDKFEGSDYQRLNVIVNNEDNEPVEAVTYINNRQAQESKPSAEYLAIIRQGYKDWRLI
ncbi:MAG: gamma-glutamylcyclotransferase [Dehalococcoidales bacterium]|nr:gamma-glutamylcyclotransferase [Dehalococcoidales bacterium]